MNSKFTSLLVFSFTLLTACTSNPVDNQKVSTEYKKGRLPTSFSEHIFTCSDEANAGLRIQFDYNDDAPSTVEIKNIKAANTDTNLTEQKYNVIFDAQTSPSGVSTLMHATYRAQNGSSDGFFFQVATELSTPAPKARPGKFSIRNLMGQVTTTNLVCCNEGLKPLQQEGIWLCD